MSNNNVGKNNEVTSETSAVWNGHICIPNTPDGFTLRTTFPTNPAGVEVMLEKWEAGAEEPPHGDHVDYLVDSHLHHQHNGHCDNHGPIFFG